MVVIVNIVATGNLSNIDYIQALDDFGPRKWQHILVPLPRSKCLLFPNGAVTIVGIRAINHLATVPRELSLYLPGSSLNTELQIRNIVGTFSLGHKIVLEQIYEFLKQSMLMSYSPEMFPGLKVTIKESLVALLFHSGKVVITGAKIEQDLKYAEDRVIAIVRNIKGHNTDQP